MTSSTFIGKNGTVYVCGLELLLKRRGIHLLDGKKDKRLAFSDIDRVEFRDATYFYAGFIHFVSTGEPSITSIFAAVQNENCIAFNKRQQASFNELHMLVNTIHRLGHLPTGFKPYIEKASGLTATKTSNTLRRL